MVLFCIDLGGFGGFCKCQSEQVWEGTQGCWGQDLALPSGTLGWMGVPWVQDLALPGGILWWGFSGCRTMFWGARHWGTAKGGQWVQNVAPS